MTSKLWKEYKIRKRDSKVYELNVERSKFSKITKTSNVKKKKLKNFKSAKLQLRFSKIKNGVTEKRVFGDSAFYTQLDMLSRDQHYFAGHCLVHDLTFMRQG